MPINEKAFTDPEEYPISGKHIRESVQTFEDLIRLIEYDKFIRSGGFESIKKMRFVKSPVLKEDIHDELIQEIKEKYNIKDKIPENLVKNYKQRSVTDSQNTAKNYDFDQNIKYLFLIYNRKLQTTNRKYKNTTKYIQIKTNIKTINELGQYLLFLEKKYANLNINDHRISTALIPIQYLKKFLNIMINKTTAYSDKYPNIPLCINKNEQKQFNLRDNVLNIKYSHKDSSRELGNFEKTYNEIAQICKSKKISDKQFIKYSFYFKRRCNVEMRTKITPNEKKNCTAINSNTNIERDNEQIDHNNYKNLPNYQQNAWADGTRVIGYTIEETTKYGNDVSDFSDTEDSHDSDNDKKLSILAKQCVEQNRKRLISEETSRAKACNKNFDNQNKKIKTDHKNLIIEKTIPSQSITISYKSSATDNAKTT